MPRRRSPDTESEEDFQFVTPSHSFTPGDEVPDDDRMILGRDQRVESEDDTAADDYGTPAPLIRVL